MDNDTRNNLIMATDRLRQCQETAKQRGEKKLWQEVMLPCSFEDILQPREIIDAFQVLNKQSLQKDVQRNTEWILLTQGLLFYYGVLRFRQIVRAFPQSCISYGLVL